MVICGVILCPAASQISDRSQSISREPRPDVSARTHSHEKGDTTSASACVRVCFTVQLINWSIHHWEFDFIAYLLWQNQTKCIVFGLRNVLGLATALDLSIDGKWVEQVTITSQWVLNQIPYCLGLTILIPLSKNRRRRRYFKNMFCIRVRVVEKFPVNIECYFPFLFEMPIPTTKQDQWISKVCWA